MTDNGREGRLQQKGLKTVAGTKLTANTKQGNAGSLGDPSERENATGNTTKDCREKLLYGANVLMKQAVNKEAKPAFNTSTQRGGKGLFTGGSRRERHAHVEIPLVG